MEPNIQTYTLPRETFNLLVDALGGQQKAEGFARSMESFLVAIDNKTTAGIVEKKEMIKIEIRDDLRKELVTREIFDETLKNLRNELRERFNVVDERFNVVDEKFKGLDEKFKVVDEKFKSLNFKLNLFLTVALIAMTFANPAFVELIKKAF